jgi:hypothetical protein
MRIYFKNLIYNTKANIFIVDNKKVLSVRCRLSVGLGARLKKSKKKVKKVLVVTKMYLFLQSQNDG